MSRPRRLLEFVRRDQRAPAAGDAAPAPALAPPFLVRFAPVTQIRVLLLNLDYSDDSDPPAALDKIDAMIAGMQQRVATESYGTASAVVDVVDVLMPQGIDYYRGKDFVIRVRHDALHTAGYGTAVPAGYHCVAFLGP